VRLIKTSKRFLKLSDTGLLSPFLHKVDIFYACGTDITCKSKKQVPTTSQKLKIFDDCQSSKNFGALKGVVCNRHLFLGCMKIL